MAKTKVERFTSTTTRKTWLAWGLATVLTYGTAALVAYELVERERQRLTDEWTRHLDAIAAQNAEVARLWFFERGADAEVLADSPLVRRAMARPVDPEAQRELHAVLERVRASYGYTEVFVLDAAAGVVGGAPSTAADDTVVHLAQRTMQEGHPQGQTVDGGVHVGFSASVPGPLGGAVVLEMDPRTALHPRLTGPENTESGEALLVGTGADGVIVLSPRRGGNGADPPLTMPAASTPLAAELAAGSSFVAGERRDYRGVPVLVATRRIGATGFAVLTKVDVAEALAPLRAYRIATWANAGVASLALLSIATALQLRQRGSRLRRELARKEQALLVRKAEEHSERLGRALDQASDEIYILDASSRCILETNARARLATGYDAAALAGLSVTALEPEQGQAGSEAADLLASVAMGRRTLAAYTTIHRRADGSLYPVEVRLHRADIGESPALVLVATDASERRDMQAQLLQAQKMEAVGRLAGGIAHDFNNLLTVMLVSLDSLKNGVAPTSDLREEAEEALAAAQRAAELTHQLLSFSRKQTLQPVGVDLNEVLRGFSRLLQRALREDIPLELALADTVLPVRVDRGQLEQAMLNLVVNARDAMPSGGRVTVETALSTGAGAPRDIVLPAERCALLRVRDTGVGMDEETLRRAFDPFFTTKPIGAGTGLGLSMVYGFVQQSGGAITARSKQGAGTSFEIYFPLASADGTGIAPTTPPTVAKAARGELVLVVDDAPQVRAIAARALRGLGYSVLEAQSGAEALRIFDEHKSDIALVLTDVAMPGMNGRALADALRVRAATLPVLFMSGYAEDAVLREGSQAARERFLAKPFTPDRLASAVRALLDLPV